MHPIFPIADRGGVDAEFACKLPLRQPSGPLGGTETFWEGGCLFREIVAQKSDDGGSSAVRSGGTCGCNGSCGQPY